MGTTKSKSKPDKSKIRTADAKADKVSYNKMGHLERTSHKDGATDIS